ncbi:MAG: tRNA (N6-isopentenyl adenosine(37)-C2)-methylthiotransferase MiaB [Dehalogenimonas sp.]|uniref:tRNA-2-methylthio-N(6)-dimethylallyladenosine synthase n=1 Tax=Candidatus Dehalogenimonas loeffleri TaxID=3127115 RepID=A0ABZ2JBH9_9CHLR|nr:tRNA (N6-isopentenyl adenosine(37)-C2)-methylthiotransferase MiaB [Dehalogenimonas sp.]
MPEYHIFTIGCQMNQSEAERLETILGRKGYFPVDEPDQADLVLLISCAVRQSAEERITNRLAILKKLKAQRPALKVALTGCMVGEDIAAMKKQYPMVDYFFNAGALPDFLDEIPQDTLPEKPDVSVLVPIVQGCDNFCSYCIVPYRRGRETSRLLDELTAEVRELVARGAREVTLLGQNVNAYGQGLPGEPDLADLLAALNGIEGLRRLRFLTNHPKDMSDRLITAIGTLSKVCPAINLPVQAGDDEVLRRMRRGYTSAEYRALVACIRRSVPDISLTTDVIVGFPGESEAQYLNTRRLIEDLRFDAVHSAVYSPRPGTEAAEKYDDDVPAAEKSRRLADLEVLQTGIAEANNQSMVGTVTEVLVENEAKGKWRGRERHGKLVFFESRLALKGQLVNIRINAAGPWSLRGELVTDGT